MSYITGYDSTDHTFQDAATSTGNGTAFKVGIFKNMTIEIYGTSSSRTVTFYGKSFSGTLRPLSGYNTDTRSMATSTTGTGETWQFDITGFHEIIMDLTAVSGGNVTVKGRAVT